MFRFPPSSPSSYGNQPLAGQPQAAPAVPGASRPDDGNATSIIAQGVFSHPAWLKSGLPARRDQYVKNCLDRAAIDYAQERLGVSQEQYARESAERLWTQLPAPPDGAVMAQGQIKQQLYDNATQSWIERAAPHIAAWKSASASEAYQQAQAAAEETWNRLVTEHVRQLGRAQSPGQPLSVAPQAGAASRAATLRDAWTQRSGAGNALAAETNVFEQAFEAAAPGLAAGLKRRHSSSQEGRRVGGPRPDSAAPDTDDGSEEMAALDLAPASARPPVPGARWSA
jgi:hypothetical protein